jgi:hypothetical protein
MASASDSQLKLVGVHSGSSRKIKMNVGLWLLLDNQDWQAKPPHSTNPSTFQLLPLSHCVFEEP